MKDEPNLSISIDECPFIIEFYDGVYRYQVEMRAVDIFEVVARKKDEHGGLVESTGYLEMRRAF